MKIVGQTIGEWATRTESCGTHGHFESRNYVGNIWSRCPACAAKMAQKEKEDAEKRAAQERVAAWQRKIGFSGIPERFQGRTLDGFVASTDAQRRALAFCVEYAGGFDDVSRTGRSALFVGRPGTGKTHLACAVGMQIMRHKNRTVWFTTVMRAIRRVKDAWSRDAKESEGEAVAAMVVPDLLILDEVGVQFGSEFERNILFDALNERYERRRPTILMSNLSVVEVGEYLGERIVDRIREDGGARIVFDWDSYRREAK